MQKDSEMFDEAWHSMFDELAGESERACAIVGAAYLDDLLGQIIDLYMLENKDASDELLSSDNPNAPLGSFGSRILVAYGTGLISEDDWKALRRVKKIRNKFAHNLTLSFDDSDISSNCRELRNLVGQVPYIRDDPSPREIYQSTIAVFAGKFKEKLYLLRKFNVSGGFGSVLRLSNALSQATKAN